MNPFWLSRAHSVAVPTGLSEALVVFSSSPPHPASPSTATVRARAAAMNFLVLTMTTSLS